MKRLLLFIGFPTAIAALVLVSYLSGGRYVVTENAYIRSGKAMVSAGSAGYVERVLVKENQTVEKGDLLFELDLQPFHILMEQAQARLETARDEIALLKSDYQAQNVRLNATEDDKIYILREYRRVKRLTNSRAISEEKIAEHERQVSIAKNAVLSAKANVEIARSQLGGRIEQNIDEYPRVREALSLISQIELDTSQASIRAGMSGVVAKIDLHPGEYVQKGQPIFSLIQNGDLWVEANLKETQLTSLVVGQSASFEIDAYPGKILAGTVSSIAPASGAEFAILPPQNATGNWVKVTQRVPVRLVIAQDQQLPQLRAGMSVAVTVDTEQERTLKGLLAQLLSLTES